MATENDRASSDDSRSPTGAEVGREAGALAENLKSVGIDTDRMTEEAGAHVSELQSLLIDEVRAQPLRALAWAAAAGVVFGFWAAK